MAAGGQNLSQMAARHGVSSVLEAERPQETAFRRATRHLCHLRWHEPGSGAKAASVRARGTGLKMVRAVWQVYLKAVVRVDKPAEVSNASRKRRETARRAVASCAERTSSPVFGVAVNSKRWPAEKACWGGPFRAFSVAFQP